jgi:hypothetical protein
MATAGAANCDALPLPVPLLQAATSERAAPTAPVRQAPRDSLILMANLLAALPDPVAVLI